MVDLLFGDDERWFESDDARVIEGVGDDDSSFYNLGGDELADFIHGEFDADHETLPPDVGDKIEVFDVVAQFGHESLAEVVSALGEVIAFDDFESFESGGAGEGVSAKGGGVGEGVLAIDGIGDLLAEHGCADGHGASAEGFGEGHDVGMDFFMLGAEHFAGASDSGLDFIDDEESAVGMGCFL